MKKLLLILLLPVFAYSTELWSELYSESIYRSEMSFMKDTYYGTLAAGVSFATFDAYIISHRFTLTKDGCFDVGPGIRKSIQVKDLSINPFGEVLFQKDSNIGVKVGMFISYRRKI